jgi:hypothetical protein
MAKSWFLYNGHSCDGPTNPDNYCIIRVLPDCICGCEVCAIYADIQVTCCKLKPIITTELQMEIEVAKISGKPSSNVLLKSP